MTADFVVVTRQPPGDALTMFGSIPHWVWMEDSPIDPRELSKQVERATGLYSMLTDQIDADLLDRAPRLRVVSQMAVGVDNIDLVACRDRGVAVGHTPDVLTETTADLAFGLIIAGARRFAEGRNNVITGEWGTWHPEYLLGHDVHNSTLGIVGFGRIGQAIARRASGFSMRVLYNQRHQHGGPESITGPMWADLETLLKESDHVVLAAPLTPDTRHLIGTRQLAAMKPTATLVNIARGPLVDGDALAAALMNGDIASAALDVTDPEPIPVHHPLVSLPNCLIVPHLGSSTVKTRNAMARMAARNLLLGLDGLPLEATPVA